MIIFCLKIFTSTLNQKFKLKLKLEKLFKNIYIIILNIHMLPKFITILHEKSIKTYNYTLSFENPKKENDYKSGQGLMLGERRICNPFRKIGVERLRIKCVKQ